MSNQPSSIKEFLVKSKEITDQALHHVFDTIPQWNAAPVVKNAMKHTVFSGGGGKRIRPCLTYLSGVMFDNDMHSLQQAAAAVELIHSYTLIVDDIQDQDDMRRGEPTCHVKYGLNMSLLAAGRLLFEGFSLLNTQTNINRKIITDVLHYLHAGQETDILSDNYPPEEKDTIALDFILRGKTGALFELSMLAGTGYKNISEEKLALLRQAGSDLGFLFQAVDDYTEVTGLSSETGKPAQKDRGGKLTFMYLHNDKLIAKQEILTLADKTKNILCNISNDKSDLFVQCVDLITGKLRIP